ncbi:MAG: hypothetical protein IKU37_01265 [Candidatus Gastranaerophilales bacterium]|nr:hypothetical protein [Candidatus Gastranaerophilales bacterium]
MEKVKIKDIKTGATKEVKKSLAGDYIGTGKFELVDEKDKKKVTSFTKKD